MRIRIVRPLSGIYDGVSLSRLLPGVVYEVQFELAVWLIAQAAAEEDWSSAEAIVLHAERRGEPPGITGGVIVTTTPKTAVPAAVTKPKETPEKA